ncbi:hypothetical protein [Delftia sp. WSY_22]|uniref:hypothetical protein n=1 Tax=Delftia sp. WSY_22 TaxID=3367213 RepID=UPI00370C3A3B
MNHILHLEIKTFWKEIQYFLSKFNADINRSVNNVISNISCNSNESFPLNGYLALARSIDSNELAIVINVHLIDDTLNITSDACMEDGRIINKGPSAQLPASTFSMDNIVVSNWLHEFSSFLDNEKENITTELLHG